MKPVKREAGRTPLTRRLVVPGGRDGRRMLVVAVIDKIGTGLWAGASTLYFIYVAHLSVGQIGTLLGVSGVLGIAGPPLAGRLADRFPVTRLLVVAQLVRGVALLALLTTHAFLPLMLYSALGALPDRASGVLTKLFAARVAGPHRIRYQAIQRTAVNIGWAVGGSGAAAVLTVGTTAAYQTLLLANVASYAVIAVLTLRCAEPRSPGRVVAAQGAPADGPTVPEGTTSAPPPDLTESPDSAKRPNPWRDRRYLAFTGTEVWLFLDDSVLQVGFPLWIVHATTAPVGLAPLVLVVNSLLVVALQVPLSRFADTSSAARRLLLPLSAAFLTGVRRSPLRPWAVPGSPRPPYWSRPSPSPWLRSCTPSRPGNSPSPSPRATHRAPTSASTVWHSPPSAASARWSSARPWARVHSPGRSWARAWWPPVCCNTGWYGPRARRRRRW